MSTSDAADPPPIRPVEEEPPHERGWGAKFRDALRGLRCVIRGEISFYVHLFAAALVIATAAMFEAQLWQWSVLLLCIATVMTAEMFNSALEHLAKAVTHENDEHVRDALDIASGGVLVASFAAAVIGTIVFIELCGSWLLWW